MVEKIMDEKREIEVKIPAETEEKKADNSTVKIAVEGLNFHYGKVQALKGISIDIKENHITAFIGPSGCGKSTFLRCLNRMNDLIPGACVSGKVFLDGTDIYSKNVDLTELRRKVGMVFQKSNPFPKSIFENVAYGLKIQGITDRNILEETVEKTLKAAALWDEAKDKLYQSAMKLSGGQQQRVCIARALAVEPEVLLMDEPASALDPISTAKIEELILDLKKKYTIVIVTHNMQQAARISDSTGFFFLGEMVEFDQTSRIFTNPKDKKTEDYVTGRFG
jgi:phosphate transport system ATP-binding protein